MLQKLSGVYASEHEKGNCKVISLTVSTTECVWHIQWTKDEKKIQKKIDSKNDINNFFWKNTKSFEIIIEVNNDAKKY